MPAHLSFLKVTAGSSCKATANAQSIDSRSACEAAALELGVGGSSAKAVDDGQSGNKFDPSGCYVEESVLKFNSDGSNTGPCTVEDVCICSSAIPKTSRSSQCSMVWSDVTSPGCFRTNDTVCKEAGLGLLTSNMTRSQQILHNDGCGATCQSIRNIPHDLNALYYLNVADAIWVTAVMVGMVAMWVTKRRNSNDGGEDAHPEALPGFMQRHVSNISSLALTGGGIPVGLAHCAYAHSEGKIASCAIVPVDNDTQGDVAIDDIPAAEIVPAAQIANAGVVPAYSGGPLAGTFTFFMFFAFIDVVLQISALVYAGKINAAIKPFEDAGCIQLTNLQGFKHTETQTKLLESVSTAIALGSIELVIMIGEVGSTFYGRYTKEESVRRVLAYFMVVLQASQVVLAIVDCAVFTTRAWREADSLFTESIKDLKTDASAILCVSLDDNSLKCLANEQSNMAKVLVNGRRLPSFAGVNDGAPTSTLPTSSSRPLPAAAVAGMLVVVGVAVVGVVAARWARKRRVATPL